MTDVTLAEMLKELGCEPVTAKGWTWTWQRSGRYEYRRHLTHLTQLTNPDHLAAIAPSTTRIPPPASHSAVCSRKASPAATNEMNLGFDPAVAVCTSPGWCDEKPKLCQWL